MTASPFLQRLFVPCGLIAVGIVFVQNGVFGQSGDSYVEVAIGA